MSIPTPPGALENFPSVAWGVGLIIFLVVSIVVATWRLLVWQEKRIKDIVTDAASGWNAPIMSALTDHGRRLVVLESGYRDITARLDNIRVVHDESIKRVHERIDDIMGGK